MIEALDRSAVNGPKCIARCDDCGHPEYVAADYERLSSRAWRVNEAQAIHKLTKHGWSHVKGRLRCMACELKRKNEAKKPMSENVTQLRQPSREQKRQIIDLLSEVYDTKAEKFKACESDVTVAEAIGGGIMFGWVAQIREELFGPDGGNEELEALIADIALWRGTADKLSVKVHAALNEFDQAREKVGDMQRRLDALLKAAGPRARSA